MTYLVPALDHLVVDVQDQMERAVRTYRSLGFQLTERGYHTLGSINHLAVFGTNYLELLGYPGTSAARADVALFPAGLNGMVFKTGNAQDVSAALQAAGYGPQPVQSFSRPVTVGGATSDAKFRTVHVPQDAVPWGRLYFCEQLTPELVWRPEWQRHPNGVTSISRVIVAAVEPASAAKPLERLFGAPRLHTDPNGSIALSAGDADVVFAPREVLAATYGGALAEPRNRATFMAVIVLRTSSAAQTMQALRAGGISPVQHEERRIVVAARDAMNVTLVFVE